MDSDDATTPAWTPQTSPRGSDGTAKKPRTWTCRLGDHDYELDVHPGVKTRLVLRVDGVEVYDKASSEERRRLPAGEKKRHVEVRLSSMGKIRRATAVDNGTDLDFDAPAGSRAAQTQEWGRAHPTLFALRHVGIKVGVVALAFLGIGALVKLLVEPIIDWIAERTPRVDVPEIPWPHIPWPQISLPRIPWPDIPPPEWLIAFLEWVEPYESIVKALIIGIALAIVELRRQRRQRRLRESGTTDRATPAELTE